MKAGRALVNGETIDFVSIQDRGFQYGDGLFETFAVRDGKPLLWERHLARLMLGAKRLQMALPDSALLQREALALCRGLDRAVLKLVITRGNSARGYRVTDNEPATRVLSVHDWPQRAESEVAVRLCQTRLAINPALAGIKHLNRLEQVLARAEWGDEFAEGVVLDTAGQVIEATGSNIFIVKDSTLLTPDLRASGIAGVMRAMVLECAAARNISCEVTSLSVDALLSADEMFLTNSIIGIRSVKRFEQKTYAISEITQTLRQDLETAGATA